MIEAKEKFWFRTLLIVPVLMAGVGLKLAVPGLFFALVAMLPLLGGASFPVGAMVVLLLVILGFSIYTNESGIIPF